MAQLRRRRRFRLVASLLMNRFAHPRSQMRAPAARAAAARRQPARPARLGRLRDRPAERRCRGPAAAAQRNTLLPAGQKPNFVVIQTDDQTLDQLYATFTPPGGAADTRRCRTRSPDRRQGDHLQPLLRLLPALLPLAGQPADRPLRPQPQRPRQRAAERRLHRLQLPPGQHPQPRDLAAGRPATARSTSASSSTATATSRTTTAQPCRPGWNSWHTVLQSRHQPLLLRLHAQQQRHDRRARSATPAAGTRANTAQRDDFGCPFAPLNGLPCLYETDIFTRIAWRRDARNAGRTALLPAARLHRPARRLPPPRRARAGDPPLRLVRGRAATRTTARKASTRATSPTSPASSAKPPYLSPTETHTYRVYYQKELESLRAVDDGVQADHRHARRDGPPAQHLHHLHLRQRLLLRRAPPDRRQVPRLRAGHPPAVPDPRAGDQAGHHDRRAGVQHRHRADDPRAGRRQPRTKASTAARWSPSCATRPCAPGGRCSSSPSSRPATSKPRAGSRRVPSRPGTRARAGRAGEASASILAPPKDYVGIRLGPYKYIAWPTGEKELYDINKDPNELNNLPATPNFFPIRDFLHTRTDPASSRLRRPQPAAKRRRKSR